MNRTEFFNSLLSKQEYVPPQSDLTPYSGKWDESTSNHLLKRLCFGAKVEDVKRLAAMSMSQAVDSLLNLDAIPDPPVNVYSTPTVPDPDAPYGKTFVNAPLNAALPPEYYQARMNVVKAWWTGNMVQQKTTIVEKMTLFWHNHFATEADTVQAAQVVYYYYKLMRDNCLGNFKQLTFRMSKDLCMLRYLNGYLNSKNAPDENYGRELLELFTVGKGPDSKYTEDDVKAAARVLTGHRINPLTSPMSYFFLFTEHDLGTKTFSSFFNNKVIAGKLDGDSELNELITMLFDQTETARHLVRKLYQFFIYYKIDDTIENTIIRPLADQFKANGYEIKPILSTLFKSAHFYDLYNRGCVIKNPLDYAVGMVREFSVTLPNKDLLNTYQGWGLVAILSAYQGLNIADPPLVSGWQAWYQSPQYHEIWINADTLANRNKVAEGMNSGAGINISGLIMKIDPIPFTLQMSNPSSAQELTIDAIRYLYNLPLSDQSVQYFKNFLYAGLPDESYWTVAWAEFQAKPNDPIVKSAVSTRLSSFYKEIISQAEYHLS
ncbi:MAG TPA: DUF1800 domain-containing protein [Saprospiraceae bacterium]|nr:DUF1800 domain-containing protein [Saprospiraceae bacterium]